MGRKLAGGLLIAAGVLAGVSALLHRSSLGVIGGADGPTAIFVAGDTGGALAIAGLVLAAAGVFLVVRAAKKR